MIFPIKIHVGEGESSNAMMVAMVIKNNSVTANVARAPSGINVLIKSLSGLFEAWCGWEKLLTNCPLNVT